jgi:hypothetical protein
MDERRNNTYGPLMYKKDISYFHMGIQEKNHHESNWMFEKNDYLIQKW